MGRSGGGKKSPHGKTKGEFPKEEKRGTSISKIFETEKKGNNGPKKG